MNSEIIPLSHSAIHVKIYRVTKIVFQMYPRFHGTFHARENMARRKDANNGWRNVGMVAHVLQLHVTKISHVEALESILGCV